MFGLRKKPPIIWVEDIFILKERNAMKSIQAAKHHFTELSRALRHIEMNNVMGNDKVFFVDVFNADMAEFMDDLETYEKKLAEYYESGEAKENADAYALEVTNDMRE